MPLERLDRYEIVGTLGQGAMGVVYKARDPLIERTVAIKTVSVAGLSREEIDAFEQRFYREAKSAGRLNHPNIVTIYDVGKSGDLAYIAMELLEGQSLRELLDSGVALPPERIAGIVARVADGLAFAHRNDVVHRDIKPANIMVLRNDRVKIADFGVALLPAGSRTVAGTVFGSPRYMSPEQVVGRAVDGRSDIFSLGAVLYEMLTGAAPFGGEDLNAILYQVLNEMPAPPSSRNRQLAPAFDRIVARAMAKHPDERYPSAREMAADLRDFRAGTRPAREAAPGKTLERRAVRRSEGEATVQLPAAADGAAGAASRTRRKALIYGLPLALLAVLGAWGLARKAAPERAKAPARAAVAAPEAPAARKAPAREKPRAAAPSPPSPSAPPAETRAAAKAVATVNLAVAPWGEVYVDGKRQGVSPPLTELKLAPGRHSVEIRNAGFPPRRASLELEAGESTRIKHKFQ